MLAPQQNLVSRTGQVCRKLLDLMADMERIDVLYSGSADWDSLITNEALAEVPSFAAAGITATTVADAVYQIKLIRQQVMTGNLAAMMQMGELS